MKNPAPVYVVIMAGGGGTRFWPWSREKLPKQILPILSERSMIYETVDRISSFIPPKNILIVTSRVQVKALHREVPQIPRSNLLVEPFGRNTAPCLCFAALHIHKINPAAVMVVLPADHFIGDIKGFLSTLKAAVHFAGGNDVLITLGVTPTEPETGYGYIQRGRILGQAGPLPIYQVKAFREKPNRSKAKGYLKRGDYFWNSGMFIGGVEVFLQAFQKYLPQMYDEMVKIRPALGTPSGKKALAKAYSNIQPVSIDYGIMEKAGNVALLEARFPWNDVGSWAALAKAWKTEDGGNVMARIDRQGEAKVLAIDSSNCVICGGDKLVALVGMKDTVLVETKDALLVCSKDRSQDVRLVLEEIKKRGWKQYL